MEKKEDEVEERSRGEAGRKLQRSVRNDGPVKCAEPEKPSWDVAPEGHL